MSDGATQQACERSEPSPGARRTQRHRERRSRGDVPLAFDLYREGVDRLVELGWLPEIRRADRKAVIDAFVRFSTRSLELGVRPKPSGAVTRY